jgi:hypothetical protein
MSLRRKRTPSPPPSDSLAIRPGNDALLSRTQVEFNRLMKRLEATKAHHSREQARLDEVLAISIRELMPLIEDLNRVNRDLILTGFKALKTLKLTARRQHWFADLLAEKTSALLADPVGISDGEFSELDTILDELDPPDAEEEQSEAESGEFHFARAMMEKAARELGLDLDLSDLDTNGDPREFERIANDRLRAAIANQLDARPKRKPTKAQAEKERKRLELEDAKSRDLKSLFKQLAKAFHPDLEPDSLLREHKKVWMQRLNTAYAANDLREMLQLEMEWLGEEATNLTTAGDQKLQVYCMVLKEQIADLKRQTHELLFQPQYGPLQRFRDPYYGTLASPFTIRRELREELIHYRNTLEILTRNDANSRRLIYTWADEHARRSGDQF